MGYARSFDRCIRRRDDPRRACGSVPALPAERRGRAAMGKKEASYASSTGISGTHSSCSRRRWLRRRRPNSKSRKRRSRIFKSAILRGELTSTRVVQLYLNRIKAYNGTCVRQPDGVLGQVRSRRSRTRINSTR